ncbi:hypothetical protein ABZ816_10440 [Actinosynnema sp. NPDC047251]|uniref:DUF8017 domain-containing protein n=1 Tax=Saccharothrix espanaensis (strain ATCC 51144 / DSM 44229 / JCM 9112 / NBRC 15066 / NRRL 15764) TaxID=1179773 RepID=K0K7A9_SACES|nr:hypothetical protein [Saccharothrix espanaensis]CCH34231.1 hypothetical protein BN6_69950 [Saccharothrix espanaensis DSM 44229]
MSYTGLGVYQQQPKPPNRRPLWIALAVAGVLAVVGGGTAAVLLTGNDATSAPTTSATTTAKPDWTVVEDTQAGLRYEVPPSWETSPVGTVGAVRLTKSQVSRPFDCQGRNMIQAMVASGTATGEVPDVAEALIVEIARTSYTVEGQKPKLGKPEVRGVEEHTVASVEVTPSAVSPCYAPKATVRAYARSTRSSKVAVLVLNVAEGGPYVAEGPSEDDVNRIMESVRPL